MRPVKIMTIRPPWAQAIFHGKDVENRTRNIAGSYRGPVAVHVGLRFDNGAWGHAPLARWMREYWGLTRENFTGESFRGGMIIGVVDLVDVHHCFNALTNFEGCSPWAELDRWHLVLANPRPLADPLPYRGALGLRTLDDDTTARILALIGDPQ